MILLCCFFVVAASSAWEGHPFLLQFSTRIRHSRHLHLQRNVVLLNDDGLPVGLNGLQK